MGLLTSDSVGKSNKLTKVLINHNGKLSFICFILGMITIVYFISECDRTYFSDNALLPGLVQREFTNHNLASQILASLTAESKQYGDRIPYQWIMNEFRNIGIEVYTHNFTLNYPFGSKPKYKGKNVYAILRSSRAPSTEAIVLSSPYRTNDSPHGSTLPGIALMIAIAKYFTLRTYWAKDIIFLISDHELIGMQSWLEAYHDSGKLTNPVLDYGILEARSGPIQAAVNLEIHSEQTTNVDIKIEGLNGQLPNLDLFNVAVELCTRESITPSFHGHSHPMESDRFELWKQYAITIGSMIISQGITLPNGAHGLFQRFNIQSITLEAPEAKVSEKDGKISVSLLQHGRLIEGIFRCLNNLLEKFNRSYYFYLLTSTRRYISIGYYMIPFGLITVPLILKALYLYLRDNNANDSSESLWNSLPFCFTCHFFGLLMLLIPYFTEKFSFLISNYAAHDVIYYTLLTSSIIFIVNPLMKTRVINENSRMIIVLLNLALLLCSLSLINISFAFGLSIIYVPIACVSGKCSKSIYRVLNSLMVILLHPLVIGFLCLFTMSLWYDTKVTLMSHFMRAFNAQRKVILFYIEDWYIYGNWTYFFGCSFLFPVWLQLWSNI